MKKTAFLFSAVFLLGTVAVQADNTPAPSVYHHFDDRENDAVVIFNSKKERRVFDMQEGDYKFVPLNEQKVEEQAPAKTSWTNYLASGAYEVGKGTANLGLAATRLGANAVWNISSNFVDWGLRTAIAYNIGYYNTEAIEWGVRKGAGLIASFAFGPAAGPATEAAVGTALKIGHFFVPGFEALIAGAAIPVVKPITDYAINSTPTVLKAAGSAAKSMWSFGKSAANYLWGNTQAAAAA